MNGSIYIHVPFCRRKCPYCHFFVHPNRDHELYLDALKREWEMRKEPMEIESVYFGGGTPYLIGPKAIEEILSWIDPPSSAEITLEANPEDVSTEGIAAFRAAGINRISLGVQTLDDQLLKTIGRNHSAEQAIEAVMAANIGNLSIDLMIDLPGQTVESVETTFQKVQDLPIQHLSLYNLVLEPPSLFYSKRETIRQPPEEESVRMLERAIELVEMERYEISAFAKPGFRSRHNTGYWTGRPFLGLGPSAFSYWNGQRTRNVGHLKKYSESLATDYTDNLTPEERQRELLAVGLRLVEGVPYTPLPEIDQLLEDRLLERRGSHIALTERGRLFYDTVAATLI